MNWGNFVRKGGWQGMVTCLMWWYGMAWPAYGWIKDIHVCDHQTMASNLLDSFIALLYIKAINL